MLARSARVALPVLPALRRVASVELVGPRREDPFAGPPQSRDAEVERDGHRDSHDHDRASHGGPPEAVRELRAGPAAAGRAREHRQRDRPDHHAADGEVDERDGLDRRRDRFFSPFI